MQLGMSEAISAYNEAVNTYTEQTSEAKEVRELFSEKVAEVEKPQEEDIEDKAFISEEAKVLFASAQEDTMSLFIGEQIPEFSENVIYTSEKNFENVNESHEPEKKEYTYDIKKEQEKNDEVNVTKDENEIVEKGFTTVEQTIYDSNEMFNLN